MINVIRPKINKTGWATKILWKFSFSLQTIEHEWSMVNENWGILSQKMTTCFFLVKYADIIRPLIWWSICLKDSWRCHENSKKNFAAPKLRGWSGDLSTARCDDSVARSFRCRRCSIIFVVDGGLHGAVWWGVIKSPILQTWAANVAIYDLEWWKYTEKNATLMATRNPDLSPVDMWNYLIYLQETSCLSGG